MRGTLRTKRIAKGKLDSLYIDYYPKVWNPIKKIYTRREFLKLHLFVNPQNDRERAMNEVTQEIADKIFVKRMNALMLDANGIFNKDALEGDFYLFAKKYIHTKSEESSGTEHYELAVKYLKKFTGEHLKFRHIDEIFIQRFKDFLLTTGSFKNNEKLAQNSAASYFDKFITMVEEAFLQRYIPEDYSLRVKRISNVQTHFELLEDDELQLLLDNPCKNDLVFKSSMFALLTGLRFSAVKILRWNNLHWSEQLQSWYLRIVDPKPDRDFTHYISSQAVDILGSPPTDLNTPIFPKLNYSTVRYHLQMWFASLGFGDKAKFHNWRRLYATKLVEAGEEIYTVSRMVNHKNVKTTEGYTQFRAKSRVQASKKVVLNKAFETTTLKKSKVIALKPDHPRKDEHSEKPEALFRSYKGKIIPVKNPGQE